MVNYMSKIRLSKFLKNSLNLTKTELFELFETKNVTVNDNKVNLSYIIKLDDVVKVDGKEIHYNNYVYYLYNKPRGVVCTNDKLRKDSYLNFIDIKERVFCVGRLDKDSSGLLILTNDGDLFHRLLNPISHVEKEYLVTTKKPINNDFINNITKSIIINNKKTKECKAMLIDEYTFKIILTEGMYHQIRIMVKMNNNEVNTLERIRIGNIKLENLKLGEVVEVTDI